MIGLAVGGDSTEPRGRLARKYIRPIFFTLNEFGPIHSPPPPVRGGGERDIVPILIGDVVLNVGIGHRRQYFLQVKPE